MKKRGGKRANAGRPKTKSALPGGSAFAERVLRRIPECNLKGIKSAEDYALSLLSAADVRVRKETFLALLYQQFGKPPMAIEHRGNQPVGINVTVRTVGSKS